jgi:hypothetical protein
VITSKERDTMFVRFVLAHFNMTVRVEVWLPLSPKVRQRTIRYIPGGSNEIHN